MLASDDVINPLNEAHNIAVTKCYRWRLRTQPVEVCMQLDKAADYAIERGTGRKLTHQEALEMLDMCEDQGLVHVMENKQGVGYAICNCRHDCCINWCPGAST